MKTLSYAVYANQPAHPFYDLCVGIPILRLLNMG